MSNEYFAKIFIGSRIRLFSEHYVKRKEEEKQVIKLCAYNFYAARQPQRCEDLTLELKEKVQVEAQNYNKTGFTLMKLSSYE